MFENSRSTSSQRVAARRVVSLQIGYFQHETKSKITCFLFILDLLSTSPFLTFQSSFYLLTNCQQAYIQSFCFCIGPFLSSQVSFHLVSIQFLPVKNGSRRTLFVLVLVDENNSGKSVFRELLTEVALPAQGQGQ